VTSPEDTEQVARTVFKRFAEPADIVEAARAVLDNADGVTPDYVDLVDPDSFESIDRAPNDDGHLVDTVLVIAARVGPTRLIDNTVMMLQPIATPTANGQKKSFCSTLSACAAEGSSVLRASARAQLSAEKIAPPMPRTTAPPNPSAASGRALSTRRKYVRRAAAKKRRKTTPNAPRAAEAICPL